MDERRCFIRMGGWDERRCFIGWVDGRTTLFYKDGWTDDVVFWMGNGRRCFIRVDGRTTLFYKDGWTDDVVL